MKLTALSSAKAMQLHVLTRKLDGLYDAIADELRANGLRASVLSSYKSSVKVVAGLSIDPPLVRGSMRRIWTVNADALA